MKREGERREKRREKRGERERERERERWEVGERGTGFARGHTHERSQVEVGGEARGRQGKLGRGQGRRERNGTRGLTGMIRDGELR